MKTVLLLEQDSVKTTLLVPEDVLLLVAVVVFELLVTAVAVA